MKKIIQIASLLAVALCVAIPSLSAKDTGKATVAKTWVATPKNFEGKSVETYVKEMADGGLFRSDAPYAVIPITTAEQGGTDGGGILLLVPPAEVEKLEANTKPEKGKKGSTFGNKIIYKKLTATFRTVGGEPVLVIGGDTAQLAKIGKPSLLLEEQLKAAGITSDTPPAKYPKKDFVASQIGRTGRAETQVILDRQILPQINAALKAKDAKAKPHNADSLRRELRKGMEFQVDDDANKTTWRVIWK